MARSIKLLIEHQYAKISFKIHFSLKNGNCNNYCFGLKTRNCNNYCFGKGMLIPIGVCSPVLKSTDVIKTYESITSLQCFNPNLFLLAHIHTYIDIQTYIQSSKKENGLYSSPGHCCYVAHCKVTVGCCHKEEAMLRIFCVQYLWCTLPSLYLRLSSGDPSSRSS